jgi:hypothetical protein
MARKTYKSVASSYKLTDRCPTPRMALGAQVSVLQVRRAYETHFNRPLEDAKPFSQAAQEILNDMGNDPGVRFIQAQSNDPGVLFIQDQSDDTGIKVGFKKLR